MPVVSDGILGAGIGHFALKGRSLRGPEDEHQVLFVLLDLAGCILENTETVPVWQHLDKGSECLITQFALYHLLGSPCSPPGWPLLVLRQNTAFLCPSFPLGI